MSTWIKVYRSFNEWEWYQDSKAVHLFLHMLLKANHSDKSWRGIKIKKGQFITSLNNLSNETNISKQSIRTLLSRFERTNEITLKSTQDYTLVTINKYSAFQESISVSQHTTNTQPTHVQHTDNTQPTLTKNEDNLKNEKNKEIFRQFGHLKITVEDYQKLTAEYSVETVDSILDRIENHKNNKNYSSLYLTAKNWLKKEKPVSKPGQLTEEALRQHQQIPL